MMEGRATNSQRSHFGRGHFTTEIVVPGLVLLMEPAGPSRTSVTVPQRLARPGSPDQDAWKQFADHYGPRIYTWCLRWQLREAIAGVADEVVRRAERPRRQ